MIKSEIGSGLVTVANALKRAIILIAEDLEVGEYSVILVSRQRNVRLEAATRQTCGYPRVVAETSGLLPWFSQRW